MSERQGWSRRAFVRAGAVAAGALWMPRGAAAGPVMKHGARSHEDPAAVRGLALAAIDAARQAGASYADVRLTRTVQARYVVAGTGGWYDMQINNDVHPPIGFDVAPSDEEQLAVGVRVLVDGGWGFAASPIWRIDEMATLAREAVRQGRANAVVGGRVELVPAPVVTGSWTPDGVLDPFDRSPEEKLELLRALADSVATQRAPRRRGMEDAFGGLCDVTFTRCDWALATSAGTYCTQRRFTNGGELVIQYGRSMPMGGGFGTLPHVTFELDGRGWERYTDVRAVRQRIDATFEAHWRAPELQSVKPVTVGRYDVVCSADTVAALLAQTLAHTTELDRVRGYEANAGGTSYITDPLGALDTLAVGAPLLSVTANRSAPGQLATVKWDDDGVEPDDFTLIRDGVLVDFQTTRESAGWLAPAYAKRGQPLRSHGCAGSDAALSVPVSHTPNLAMRPGRDDATFDAIVGTVKRGLALTMGATTGDFQSKHGVCTGLVREITNGVLGDVIEHAGMLFDAEQLWRTLAAIGGPSSAAAFARFSPKGEPEQRTPYTLTAVPALFRDAAIVDTDRRV